MRRIDNTGAIGSLVYAKSGSTWLTFTASRDIGGKIRTQAGPSSSQAYSYDNAGRLTQTSDAYTSSTSTTPCTRRTYSFDANSNRTSLDSRPCLLAGTGRAP